MTLIHSRVSLALNREDQFVIDSYPLGALKKIRIGHDNSLVGAGWFLDKVKEFFLLCSDFINL